MKNFLMQILNIKKGEEAAIFLLLLYSFFMGLAISFFLTSATSLFVVSFESDMLPYAYIGGGIMGYLVWLAYTRAKKSISFHKVVIFGIILLLISVSLFISGYQNRQNGYDLQK